MLTLYQVEWCASCHRVRQVMTELGLTYISINVHADRDEREDLVAISGQEGVPVLVDHEQVIADSSGIIEHLRSTYPPKPDSGEHASRGRFRIVTRLAVAPPEALEALAAALEKEGLAIIATAPGETIAPGRMPDGYTLVHAASSTAAAKVAAIDPTTPSAVSIAIAVYAREGGAEIAVTKPVVGAFLFGISEISAINAVLTERVIKAIKEL
jgi:glutathione S-transferase